MKTMIPLALWKLIGRLSIIKELRPLGLWLRDRGFARNAHLEWDTRKENGEFWEFHGWRIGPFVVPFGEPRRNRIMEWTTPQVIAVWKLLDDRSWPRLF